MADVPESDESLMARYQCGEEDAFRIIFERYTTPLIHFAYRFIGFQAEAEDVAQEVFMRVYRHKERYDTVRPFRSWIFSITARLSANKARDRKIHQEISIDISGSDSEEPQAVSLADEQSAQPENIYQSQEAVQQILDVLQELPENQRMAVLLCRFEEMSYDEISQTMRTSILAVKSLIFRGMQTLGKRLLGASPQLSAIPCVLGSESGYETASRQPKEP